MSKFSSQIGYGFILWISLVMGLPAAAQQQNPDQILLQGFWWDYWNNNYPNRWADYLSDLAPRLKQMGVNGVWVPPSVKSDSYSENNVWKGNMGYGSFDHYDLGDKWQKNLKRTRMGDKNELLRMVGVLHANGINVVQDIIPNHMSSAGSATGAGGQDTDPTSMLTNSGYKNFRNICYSSPIGASRTEAAGEYCNRNGRFPKNFSDFYPNLMNPCCTNDINTPMFGPDISYESNAYGQSSNCTGSNPSQAANYMRDGMRNWLIWYKKQIGFDGVRLDAVKHYPDYVTEDFMWNLQNNAGWASGGNQMFAVGEYVSGTTDCDNWTNAVQQRSGTFDFGLRQEIYYMVTGQGNYDLGTIVNYQQQTRNRSCNFVNSHDTFRPKWWLSTVGNYPAPLGDASGWDMSGELWNGHIDPREPRLSLAYALIFALDGTPTVFFEDLFDVGTTGKRFTHTPANTTDLPTRSDIVNLMWCYQNLKFKQGAYLVRNQTADVLVVERSAKALIAMNDNWNTWQNLTAVQTNFPDGTILKDYSGATTTTRTVYGGGKVDIAIPPCDGTAPQGRKGYAVWAPNGINTNFVMAERTTTQEWEMANDLGDRDARSLGEGGALPSNSTAVRTVGKIYVRAGKPITYNIYPTNNAVEIQAGLLDANGVILSSVTGSGNLSKIYTPTASGWLTIKMRNKLATTPGQNVYVKVTYTSPQTPSAMANPGSAKTETDTSPFVWLSNEESQINIYPNPAKGDWINLSITANEEAIQEVEIIDVSGRLVHHQTLRLWEGDNEYALTPAQKLPVGVYMLRLSGMEIPKKLVIVE